MSGNSAFELVSERGWQRGMGNMLKNEFARWWKTNQWWSQALIWSGILSMILGVMLFGKDRVDAETAVLIFSLFTGLFPAVAVIIIMQDVLVGEKKEGTAAWILSKPVTRQAFLVPKVIGNSVGILVTLIVIPCAVGYALLVYAGMVTFAPLQFLAAVGVIFISHFFFLTLTLMLGTFFNSRGPVIGIAMALLFFQQYLVGIAKIVNYMLPFSLIAPLGTPPNSLVFTLIRGNLIPTDYLITAAVVFVESFIFIAIAIWRFKKEEF